MYKFTIEDVFQAAKKNGFGHTRGHWLKKRDGKLTGCVLGQSLMNLVPEVQELSVAERNKLVQRFYRALPYEVTRIIGINDHRQLTPDGEMKFLKYDEIISKLDEYTKDVRDKEVTF